MSQLSHVIHSSVGTDGTKTIITTNAIWGGVTGGSGRALNFDSGKDVIVEFIHQLNAVGAEQIGFGLSESTAPFIDYDDQTVDAACFTISAAGALYAHTSNKGVGHTETEITGITLTNKNVYRIELNPGVDVKYYVNGVLKQTLTTNLPDGANAIKFGFGVQGNSGDNHVMMSTNPQFSIEI